MMKRAGRVVMSAIAILAGALATLTQLPGLPPIPGQRPAAADPSLADALARLEPGSGLWDGEVLAEGVERQLRLISGRLEAGGPLDAASVKEVAAPAFACGTLRPADTREVFRDKALIVSRSARPSGSPKHKGAEGLARALTDLTRPLEGASGRRAEFQVVGVETTPHGAEATVRFQAGGAARGGSFEQSALFLTRWRRAADAPPLLESIETKDYEEVTGAGLNAAFFADMTEAVLGRNASFREDLVHGVDYWLERLEAWIETDSFGHNGIAVGDANGDGLDDLYVCQMGGLPNLLFLQNPDGTATDVSAQAGVDWLERTRSALFVDLDNDGDEDLVIATSVALLFMENDGRARFSAKASLSAAEGMVTAGAPSGAVRTGGVPDEGMSGGHYSRSGDFGAVNTSDLVSLAAADYDNDGLIDIYACAYHSTGAEADRFPIPLPYHDANNGGRNLMIRNEGGWRFSNVTASSGLDVNNTRFSFAASWDDFDNDGDQDLYVANDFGRNNLYRNDGGRFVDIAPQAGVENIAAGMSVSWSDYDHDGWMDLYVGNMFSPAGNRISRQKAFKPDADAGTLAAYRHHAMGNTLYRNLGNGTFADVSEAAAVAMGRWSWSSNFVDLNNDGWDDLLVANGYFTRPNPRDLSGYFWREVVGRSPNTTVSQAAAGPYAGAWRDLGRMIRKGWSFAGRERNCAFLNTKGPRFANVSVTSGLDFEDDARGLAVTDWNGDGALDVWMVNRTGPRVRLALNQAGAGSHWLQVRLEGRKSNRDAIGARVELAAGGRLLRTLRAGDGYLAQSSKWLHFGLGDVTAIGKLVVRWPGGGSEEFSGLSVDRRYRIVEGSGKAEPDRGPARAVSLAASTLREPADEDRARILLSAPVPAPSFAYETFDWRTVTPEGSGPLLIYLWSVDDSLSVAQLGELSRRAADLKSAGLRVAALSVDGVDKDQPPDPAPAQAILRSIKFPFESGYAYPDLMDKLDLVQRKVIWAPRPFPLPSSLLVDGDGLLAAIYKGPLSIDRLLSDLPALRATGEKRLSLAIPFAGTRQTRGLPTLFDYMDSVAQVYADGGYADEAAAYYRKVIRIQPARAQAHFGLGVALAGMGQKEESLAEYRKTLEIDPNHVAAMNNLGFALSGDGKTEEAIALFKKALELEPANVSTLCNLGATLAGQGQLDEAIPLYRRALEAQPEDTLALNNLAVALARQGKDAEAISTYERVLKIEPGNLPGRLNLASALIRQGKAADAVPHLTEAIRINPRQPEAHFTLGLALSRLGRGSEAIESFSETLRLRPGYSQAKYHLAIAQARAGRVEEALRGFADVMDIQPDSPEASAKLAWVLATATEQSMRDGARAIELAQRACEATGNRQPMPLDSLAAGYAEAGRFADAIRTAQQAIELAAASGDAALADAIRARVGRYQAREPFREAAGR